jgi:glycosyltransferase involved in cell wall biosynthesis
MRDAPMRVLISTSTFPLRADDGLPRFVYDLAEALAEPCEVTCLVPDAEGAAKREQMGPVDVHRFTYFLPRRWQRLAYGHGMRENLRASLVCKLQPPPFVALQARATRRLVSAANIDVVNSHWMIPSGLSSALARGSGRRGARFGHVLTVHAADVYMLRGLPLGGAIARFILDRSDHVFADGSHVRDSLDELIDRDSGAHLQPNGVSVELFREASRTPASSPFPNGYLLFFGRLAEKKGVTYLLQAMPRVLERHPGLGLVVIGYGPLEGALRAEAHSLGIDAAVEFVGRMSHAEIGSHLAGSRLAVVPSIIDSHGETEGMPTVVVEAMASGTRVVGSAVDGIPDVIRHGENGWLCREKDPADLAEKILTALDDPETSGIPHRSLDTANRFAWSEVAARYLEAFEAVRERGAVR